MITPASFNRNWNRCHILPWMTDLPITLYNGSFASTGTTILRTGFTSCVITFTQETLGFRRGWISHPFSLLIPAFSLPISPEPLAGVPSSTRNAPLPPCTISTRPVASVYHLAPLHYLRMYTRPVSYYALFQGMAASKPTSWLSLYPHFILHSSGIWGP